MQDKCAVTVANNVNQTLSISAMREVSQQSDFHLLIQTADIVASSMAKK